MTQSTERAEILSVGMVTPVGFSAAQTAASVRARLARLTESHLYDRFAEPIVMGLVDDEELPPLCDSLERARLALPRRRLVRMASSAIAEALGGFDDRVPVFMGAPEPRAEGERRIDLGLLGEVSVQTGRALDLQRSRLIARGRASGLLALHEAVLEVARVGGCVLAGAVDSYLDSDVLAGLDRAGRLRNGDIPDGFVPGEAAAFVLLGAAGAASRLGTRPLARVMGTSTGREAGHFDSAEPYRGEGLAQTFAALFDSLPGPPRVRTIYAGMNGESYWAKELGVARIRSRDCFEEPVHVEHPADTFGDAGAALGPVMLGIAALAAARGYRPGPALVYCGSDREDRAAVLIDA